MHRIEIPIAEIVRELYDPMKPYASHILAQVIPTFVIQEKLARTSISPAMQDSASLRTFECCHHGMSLG